VNHTKFLVVAGEGIVLRKQEEGTVFLSLCVKQCACCASSAARACYLLPVTQLQWER
jgi:hypothetical protein